MLSAITLFTATTLHQSTVAAQAAQELPCVVVLGGPEIAKVTQTSELYDPDFTRLTTELRSDPTAVLRKKLETDFDYITFESKSVNVCYPRNFLGIDKMKTETDLLRALVVGKVEIGSYLSISSMPSDVEAPLRKRIKSEYITPYMRQIAGSDAIVFNLQCGLMVSVTQASGTSSQFFQSPGVKRSDLLDNLPLVSRGSEADLKKWLPEANAAYDLEFRCLIPNRPELTLACTKGVTEFLLDFQERLQSGSNDRLLMERKFFDRYLREVLNIEPENFPKSETKYENLPESVKGVCLAAVRMNLKKFGLSSADGIAAMLKTATIKFRYAVPALTVKMQDDKGNKTGYGIAIGEEFRP